MWTSPYGDPFLCVTIHWIDNEWFMQKRIIGFEVLREKHSGANIYKTIMSILNRFQVAHKIFSISFDNVSNNTRAIKSFKDDLQPILGGALFHQRCTAHIINLCVQVGMTFLSTSLVPIRECIKEFRYSHNKQAEFKALCVAYGLPPKTKFGLDNESRWGSTYSLLNKAYPYREVLTSYYNRYNPESLLNSETWKLCSGVKNVLKYFDDATTLFSAVYYPTTNLFLSQAVNIAHMFDTYSQTIPLCDCIHAMQQKWLQYFTIIPDIYLIASILDPTIKHYGMQSLLRSYYDFINDPNVTEPLCDIDYTSTTCLEYLKEMYQLYRQEYAPQSVGTSSQQRAGDRKGKSSSLTAAQIALQNSKRQRCVDASNELEQYLDEPQFAADDEDRFDILEWWRVNTVRFPILSMVARDILSVPITTVASESAFSTAKRVCDSHRGKLKCKNITIQICTGDWFRAMKRTQGMSIEPYDLDEIISSGTEDTSTTDADYD